MCPLQIDYLSKKTSNSLKTVINSNNVLESGDKTVTYVSKLILFETFKDFVSFLTLISQMRIIYLD